MNLSQLTEYIPHQYISEVVIKKNLDYADIKLICGANTVFFDNCLYMGDLSDVPGEAYKDKLIGLITTHNVDYSKSDLDCIKLGDNVNILSLYEELKNLWYYNDVGTLVDTLSRIFASNDFGHIINQTSHILDNPVVLFDYNSQLLASCCDQPIDDPDIQYLLEHGHIYTEYVKEARKDSLAKKLLNSPEPIVLEANGDMITHKRILGMIWANQKPQATISVLEYNRKLTIADNNIVGSICGILSQLIQKRQQYDHQSNLSSIMYENRLLSFMKREDNDLSWVTGWLTYMHWDKHQYFYVIVVQIADYLHNNREISKIKDKLSTAIDCFILSYEDDIVIILNIKNNSSRQQYLETLKHIISEYRYSIGISKCFTEISMICEYHQQALDAIRISKLLGQQCSVSFFDDQIHYDLLLKAQAQSPLERYDDYRLSLLSEYDRHYGTNYYLTLYTYLQSACSRSRSAQRLYISRNTMDYRMNKICEMLELNKYDGEDCMRLYLAFKAKELENTVSPENV